MDREFRIASGPLSDSLQQMSEWKRKRYAPALPKPMKQKLRRALSFFLQNKLNFSIILLLYFVIETIGNAGILVISWALSNEKPENSKLVLIQLTANWPIRILRSFLSAAVINSVLQALKKKDNKLQFTDLFEIKNHISFKFFIGIIFNEFLLTSPLTVATTLFSSDFVWAIIYLIFGFILNWLFGVAQILMLEDSNISIINCYLWTGASILQNSKTAIMSFLTTLITLVLSPFIVTVPVLIVFEVLTFFDVFECSTPDEANVIN